jgi:hypothetical protein
MRLMQDIAGQDPAQAREERWSRSNPLELGKEIAAMENANVAPYIIAHARSFRDVLLADYVSRYSQKHHATEPVQ